jgi:hypothetical protein
MRGSIACESQHENQSLVQVGDSTGRIELESVWQTNLSFYSRVKANVVRAS